MPNTKRNADLWKTKIIILLIVSFGLTVLSYNTYEKVTGKIASRIISLLKFRELTPVEFKDGAIPLMRFSRLPGKYYNPVYNAMYGFSYYDKWMGNSEFDYFLKYYTLYLTNEKDRDTLWKERFLQIADWFVNNMHERYFDNITFGVWEYDFSWKVGSYDLSRGWVSGMAQGVAIQVLLRAWQITGNTNYLDVASDALRSFLVPVSKGGVTYKLAEDEWWYEEYAGASSQKTMVLNGHEHALIALWEAYTFTGDSQYLDLYNKGLNALKYEIKAYINPDNCWSLYDQVGTISNSKYHNVNIGLTRKIYSFSGIDMLDQVANAWNNCHISFLINNHKPTYHGTLMFIIDLFANLMLVLIAYNIAMIAYSKLRVNI